MRDAILERAKENGGRGLKYLDKQVPGWERTVPSSLNVANPKCCVVAHITGRAYDEGVKTLGVEDPVSLGFFVVGSPFDPEVQYEYACLTFVFRSGRDNRLHPELSAPDQPAEAQSLPPELQQQERELVEV